MLKVWNMGRNTNTKVVFYAPAHTLERIRAMGVILSRRDSNGIWRFNKCQLCCVWGNQDQFTSRDYYGFSYANARASYMANVKMTPEGNFLQTGGDEDILPTSFR